MVDKELIAQIRGVKTEKGYTLYELSRIIDVHISTLDRWLKTERINKVYAQLVRDKLGL